MSEWINFVKEFALKNNLKYKEALTQARDAYLHRHDPPQEPVKVKKEKKQILALTKENVKLVTKEEQPAETEPIKKPRKVREPKEKVQSQLIEVKF